MRHYFIHFLIAVLLLTGMLAGFNWWVDPYAIYRDSEALLQQTQPILVMNERVFKTVGLAHIKADIVILGTSRTDIGIGREHEAFAGMRVFNLATFGQPIQETRRLMETAVEQGKPRTILVGLDFFAFNMLFDPPSDYVEENYSSRRLYSLMLSVSALSDSWTAVRRKTPAAGDCCYADGFRTPENLSLIAGQYRKRFTGNERMYLLEKYLPYPECRFSYTSKDERNSMDDFRSMVRLAHQRGIDLRLFISPSHARQWETLAVAGLWEQWEDWKRQLVRINEEEAGKAESFPLWDFSGYDEVSTEAVPMARDGQSVMRWYSDSAHYTPELGKHIVRRMFTEDADTWGLVLSSANVDAHLVKLRAARERYRVTHPQDIAEIESVAREVNQVKHCPARR